jgi:hypothetical protein
MGFEDSHTTRWAGGVTLSGRLRCRVHRVLIISFWTHKQSRFSQFRKGSATETSGGALPGCLPLSHKKQGPSHGLPLLRLPLPPKQATYRRRARGRTLRWFLNAPADAPTP